MSKKIKISILNPEKMEFKIEEDAKKDDYFSLLNLEEISFDSIKDEINLRRDEYIKKIFEEDKDKLILSSKEYINVQSSLNKSESENNNLKNEIFNLKNDEVKNIEIAISKKEKELIEEYNNKISDFKKSISEKEKEDIELKNKYNNKISDLENKISNLDDEKSKDIEIAIAKKEKELIEKHNNEIIIMRDSISDLKNEIFNLKSSENKNIEIAIAKKEKELIEKYNNEIIDMKDLISKKENEINEIKNRNLKMNVKEIGEQLEAYLNTEYSNYLSVLEHGNWKKANEIIDGTKPDFIYTIKGNNDEILSSITIEAKSEMLNSKSKKKNKDHYQKLFEDSQKNNTEYSILVSELEKEDEFLIKRVPEFRNMFVVRPQFMVTLIMIIYNVALKKMDFLKQDIEIKEKQEMIAEFDEIKNDIIYTTIKYLNANIVDAIDKNSKIQTLAKKQMEDLEKAQKNTKTIQNKIESIKIEKVIR